MSFSIGLPVNALLPLAVLVLGSVLGSVSVNVQASTKVAFIGDQGIASSSQAVLALVADEDADLLMIQGDLGYADGTASQWDKHITDALGRDFPVLTVVGNHENFEWPLYQRLIQQRIDRSSGLSCRGETGVKANCRFGDLQMVQVSPAIYEVDGVDAEDNYEGFIEASFEDTDAPWRICAWHKTMEAMNTSYKGNSTGWGVFDACLDAGAMVAMAHAHTYSRTYLLSDFRNQTVVHRNDDMTLEPGRSFAFVSGLGGRDVREQARGGDWFASIYTSAQGATHGALFCDFDDDKASCYFKAIDGSVPDQFTLRTEGSSSSGSSSGSSSENNQPSQENSVQLSPAQNGQIIPGVFSHIEKDEYRWVDRNSAGEWGSVWISESCARSLGDPIYRGRWSQLIAIAPAFDTIANPCTSSGSSVPAPPPPQSESNPQTSDSGYVFSRTDKSEYRWIETTASGQVGNIWIDEECADRLDSNPVRGDWHDLIALAPGFDTADSPCAGSGGSGSGDNGNNDDQGSSAGSSAGFVYSRTDKQEYRWIDWNSSGVLGSIWINESCAEQLGGPSRFGRWSQLMELAPGFDTIANPCR